MSRGVAIPFGLFRQEALDQPHAGGGGTVFDWMVDELPATGGNTGWTIRGTRRKAEAFRAELYDIILNTTPSAAFQQQLRAAMRGDLRLG